MPTHADLPDDRDDEAREDFERIRSALRTVCAAFLVIVFMLLVMYCAWVLIEVSSLPDDVTYTHCHEVPVEMRDGIC